MEELNKRRKIMTKKTERTGRTGATTMTEKTGRTGTTGTTKMTDSFLSTKMKQLKNIQATVESTTGETQEMWITKWYQLVRSIAKEIENNS
jgi:hypothetical protein